MLADRRVTHSLSHSTRILFFTEGICSQGNGSVSQSTDFLSIWFPLISQVCLSLSSPSSTFNHFFAPSYFRFLSGPSTTTKSFYLPFFSDLFLFFRESTWSTSAWKLRNLITSRRFIFSTFSSTVFLESFSTFPSRFSWQIAFYIIHEFTWLGLLDNCNPSLSLLETTFPLFLSKTHLKRNTKENRNSYASVIRSDQRHWSIRRITADWDEMLSKRQFGAM